MTSLEVNHKPVDVCRKGVEVCLKIEHVGGEAPRLYGRHFDDSDLLVSKVWQALGISRHAIYTLVS